MLVSGARSRAADVRKKTIDVEQITLSYSQVIKGLWIGWNVDPGSVAPASTKAFCHTFVRMAFGEDE